MLLNGVGRAAVLAVLLVVAMLSTAVSGAAAAGWLAPENVSLSASDLGFDEQGNALAVGIGDGPGGTPVIRAMTRPFGGQWSDTATISRVGDTDVANPSVAVGPHGNAVVAWSAHDEVASKDVLLAATRSAVGTWSAPVVISEGAPRSAADQDVAIDAQGNATVVWAEFDGTAYIVRARSHPNGGPWSAPDDLSNNADGNSTSPQVAVDPEGNATAVWIRSNTQGVRSKRRVEGAWSAVADDVSAAGDIGVQALQVVAGSQGATAVWTAVHSGNPVVRAARRTGSTWNPTVGLADGYSSWVAADPKGEPTAIWFASTPDGAVLRSRVGTASGGWGSPVDVAADADDALIARVAVDPDGNATAIWARSGGGTKTAQASRRVADGPWSSAVALAVPPSSTTPAAGGVDPQGHATIVWSTPGTASPGLSAVFDPIAPELRSPAVPAKGIVGQPVSMSVDPFDAWSTVTTTWDFGDGPSASGASVSHTYGSPGERTVTIAGVDAAGNTTQTSLKIAIDPVPVDKDPGPGRIPGPPSQPGLKRPVLSGLRQASPRWRTHKAGRGARVPVGTTFRFKLDRAARVRLAFSEIVSGRRVKARCVKLTKANPKKARCLRSESRGTLTVAGKRGANAAAFRGKIGRRVFAPGRYRVVLTAVAGGKTSVARSVTFTVIP